MSRKVKPCITVTPMPRNSAAHKQYATPNCDRAFPRKPIQNSARYAKARLNSSAKSLSASFQGMRCALLLSDQRFDDVADVLFLDVEIGDGKSLQQQRGD